MSLDGYPLAYCIHEGNKYEGHTMLPVVRQFVEEYDLHDFIVVADSGLMTNDNVNELEQLGYKYIIGARIKAESEMVKSWILEQPKADCRMVEYIKEEAVGCWWAIPMTGQRKTHTTATRAYAALKKHTGPAN
ncbi:MAG: transposase [Bacteroides faecis]